MGDMSPDPANQVICEDGRREGQDGNGSDQQSLPSVFSIDTPEELVQFYTAEVSRLREDLNTPKTQLIAALLQLGVVLADHPDLGDAEPTLREAREFIDADNSASYPVESLMSAQLLASVLQSRNKFDIADELYTTALENTQYNRGPPEDYEIYPFKDSIIPGLPALRRSTDQTQPDKVDEEQVPVETLRTALDMIYPQWGRLTTFLEALGAPRLAPWGVVTRREVLLEQAAAVGHYSAVKLLLEKMRETTSDKLENDEVLLVRAFHRAVQSGSKRVIRLFLDYGIEPFATDEAGKPALHKAAELGLDKVLMEMVQRVDDVDFRDGNGDTALDLALRENHEGIIRLLMRQKGALLASSKLTPKDINLKKKGNNPETGVFGASVYTGLNATVVNFYVNPAHKVEEHRVRVEAVEAVVSDSSLLRSMIHDDGRMDENPDFTWIHIPANNMFWVETLMKNLADLGEDRESCLNFMTKEVWQNQLHESLHGSVHGRFMKPYCGKVGGSLYKPDMVLYMPYIHWESEPKKKEMDEAIEKFKRSAKNKSRHFAEFVNKRVLRTDGAKVEKPGGDKNWSDAGASPDSRLLRTYLYRTIVTCFPKTWGEEGAEKEDTAHILNTSNVLDSILERLDLKFREPILSVYELADVIMARCLGLPSDSTQWENERQRYLEIFEHSINYVADEEICRFNYFADGGRTGARTKLKKSKEAVAGTTTSEVKQIKKRLAQAALQETFNYNEAKAIVDTATRSKRHWGIEEKDMEDIFDISNEIELLKEIKDIQDELNILRTLFDQQSRVVDSYHRASGERTRSSEVVLAMSRLSRIVEQMDADAQRPHKAVST
ncbi:hypothetical protein ONZ43_g3067 [Nemania bipapillata]|uniref:Uncharacterized protein n=1 Tax=Nemania bipapillata TaxID=110536 RepID=A0ACC2IYC1_9PEZI|nr:hypothetical protein ONZ43_g3067 [Nemania bipapillata]